MAIEREPHPESFQPLGVAVVKIPGVKPEVHDRDGEPTVKTNIDDPSFQPVLEEHINSKAEYFYSLRDKVMNNEKSAIYLVGAGAITIFVAAAGFEFGVRDGRDIRGLFKHLRPKGRGDKS